MGDIWTTYRYTPPTAITGLSSVTVAWGSFPSPMYRSTFWVSGSYPELPAEHTIVTPSWSNLASQLTQIPSQGSLLGQPMYQGQSARVNTNPFKGAPTDA